MKRLLVTLSITFLFASITFCPKANAFPTQSYACLYIPAFGVPIAFPNVLISLGEYVAILEDLSTSFVPRIIIGSGGFFYVAGLAMEGYCDESMFIAFYISNSGYPVLEVGIPIGRLLGSSNESNEKLGLNNIAKDYLADPFFVLPTEDDFQLLKPSLIEARSSYPQYKELINLALAFIDL